MLLREPAALVPVASKERQDIFRRALIITNEVGTWNLLSDARRTTTHFVRASTPFLILTPFARGI